MRRIKKLLGIIFIFCIVFFIICDEKGYKIEFKNNHIVFDKIKKDSSPKITNLDAVYKNSDLIHINYEFQNPRNLRKSEGMDPEYLAKLEEEKLEKEIVKQHEKVYTGPSIISINDDTISSVFQGKEIKNKTGIIKQDVNEVTGSSKNNAGLNLEDNSVEKTVLYYPVKKYNYKKHSLSLSKGVKILIPIAEVEKDQGKEELILNTTETKESEPEILYKNSNKIKLYSGFENPFNLRKSAGIDEEFLVEQNEIQEGPESVNISGDNIISDDYNEEKREDSIYEVINPGSESKYDMQNFEKDDSFSENAELLVEPINLNNTENDADMVDNIENREMEIVSNENIVNNIQRYKVEKPELKYHSFTLKEGIYIEKKQDNLTFDPEYAAENTYENIENSYIYDEAKPIDAETHTVKIEKYQLKKHSLNLKRGKKIEHNFILAEDSTNIEESNNGLSDPMLESLLENEEIDIDTLESENDEFLQKVFEKTRDTNVMNLIVETYLNEYQFVKAKRFIENLPETYRNELKPSLNLRVAFNSFSISSKTINEDLNSILQDYSSRGMIFDEDKNRYLGVLALMDRNYDKFFEISAGFTSEKNKSLASKLQGYKDQISKQMGMPDYYFDTLVSLELFNQGLFQPAKILALYSLQQNSNYILPYQVLAYANFLTNSRDTSVEYLKKLVDLDPNNAEKYHFLMGVAYYRDEKYEQSVVMLSMIKDETLRLDTQRYLINDYLKLNQKNKLISSWNKLLGSENLVASDFYTYFYETFFHPYSQGEEFQLYAFDTELANKMLRVCSIALQNEEKSVCTYGTIGKNIALGQFNGLEQYLLDLVAEYPQGYLYQALGDYYIQQGDLEKAKVYLIKAISLTQKKSERSQIKKLLQDTM